MQITINLTNQEKKALRFLGKTNQELRNELVGLCARRLDGFVVEAKSKWVAQKNMDDIDPNPI